MLSLAAIALMALGILTVVYGGRRDTTRDPDDMEALLTIAVGSLVAFIGAVVLWADMLWRIYA